MSSAARTVERGSFIGVTGAVVGGTLRVAASIALLAAAAGIGLLTLLTMLLIRADIDYGDTRLDPDVPMALTGHLVVAVMCLVVWIVPALDDPLPRPAWIAMLVLACLCLLGCTAVVAMDLVPGSAIRELAALGALASGFCVARMVTALRPATA